MRPFYPVFRCDHQRTTADEIKTLLKLEPHPVEGSAFRQTYVCGATVDLPRGMRSAGTAIYYLLKPGTFSEMHTVASDEIFHFYLGDSVEMLQLYPDGRPPSLLLGRTCRRINMCSLSSRSESGKAHG